MSRANRTLSVTDVIDMVGSIKTPVAEIERDLGIPSTVLARALKSDTKTPLPVKYEFPLIEYVKKKTASIKEEEKITSRVKQNLGLEAKEPSELSDEEKDNKLYWYNKLKAAITPHYAKRVAEVLTK